MAVSARSRDGSGPSYRVDYLYVICPECSGELSRKWNPQAAVKSASDRVIAWNCSVCGGEFTREDLAPTPKPNRNSAGHES